MCTFVAAILDRGYSSQKIAEVLKNDLFHTLRLIDCSALVIGGKYVRQV